MIIGAFVSYIGFIGNIGALAGLESQSWREALTGPTIGDKVIFITIISRVSSLVHHVKRYIVLEI